MATRIPTPAFTTFLAHYTRKHSDPRFRPPPPVNYYPETISCILPGIPPNTFHTYANRFATSSRYGHQWVSILQTISSLLFSILGGLTCNSGTLASYVTWWSTRHCSVLHFSGPFHSFNDLPLMVAGVVARHPSMPDARCRGQVSYLAHSNPHTTHKNRRRPRYEP